jgi:hypothetical protein
MGLFIACLYVFCVLAGFGWVWSTIFELHFVYPLVKNLFGQHRLGYCCVLACMEWVWSSGVEMHFVYYLAFDGFGQLKLRYVL